MARGRRVTLAASRGAVDPIVAQLRTARQRRKVSIDELADVAGYHYRTLQDWEVGAYSPKLSSVRNWCEALGLDIVLIPRQELKPVVQKLSGSIDNGVALDVSGSGSGRSSEGCACCTSPEEADLPV